ncbi:MAG TPA: glycosyltransferase [Gemmatimonadales bacterium]
MKHKPRVVLYSPGMVGFGHIRRNASIAQGLLSSTLQPVIVMIAEAWQAGAIPMPAGIDCVTLPALRKEDDGVPHARHLQLPDEELVAFRARVIQSAITALEPDALIVDHLPLGAGRELHRTLQHARKREHSRCVLGMRDVQQDASTMRRTWSEQGYVDVVQSCYDAIWIYGDPLVFDAVREYDVLAKVADKVRYVGYLDQRPRLELAEAAAAPLLDQLPEGRLLLCEVGGGHDGGPLAEAFALARWPADCTGVIVTGPYMPEDTRRRLYEIARRRPRMRVVEFMPDTAPLMQRADRVVSMGGYNTMCEVLSFEKHALIVPRVSPKPEQWIRAQRMRELGLVHVLHPDRLSPRALSRWLERDLGAPPASRRIVDVGALPRVRNLLAELIGPAAAPASRTIRAIAPGWEDVLGNRPRRARLRAG